LPNFCPHMSGARSEETESDAFRTDPVRAVFGGWRGQTTAVGGFNSGTSHYAARGVSGEALKAAFD